MVAAIFLLSALSLSIVIGSTVAILAWREVPKPGSRGLAILLVGQVWWSACSFFRLRAATVDAKVFWLMVPWIGVVLIPFGWILFALTYTGRDEYLTSRYVGILSTVPLLTVVVVATHPFHALLDVSIVGQTASGVLQPSYSGLWYWTVAGYTYALGTVGLLLVVELLVSRALTFKKQGIALLVALLVPWTTNAAYVTGAISLGLDPTPIAFAFSGIVYLYALKRFQLLRANPAPTRRARQMVFDGVQEAAIIVDGEDHVVDVNDRALEVVGGDRTSIVGSHAAQLLPEYESLPGDGELGHYLSVEADDRELQFEVEVSRIRTTGGTSIGRVITLNEVTEFLRQQQRLEVLHRVLRHNIRTETNLILGYVGELTGEHTDTVQEHARRIEELGDKGREAIELFSQARTEVEPRPLPTMLEGCIADVSEDFPDVAIEHRQADRAVEVAGLLESVFANAIENGAEHNTNDQPRVVVDVTVEGDSAHVSVADNGPGIDEHETDVLSRGTETSLEHGSGIGLWIVQWGANLADGSVRFAENSPTGTVVHIDVPILEDRSREEDGPGETDVTRR